MRSITASVLVVLSGFAFPALAQVTQSYQYDGHGRLVSVTTSGPSGTNSALYAYDRSNNRTSRSQSGVTTWAAVSQLPVNRFLQPDEALVSANGRYSFALRNSGELELWAGDLPAVPGASDFAAAFRLTDDGQARFMPALLGIVSSADASVSLREDGQLALLDEAGVEVWRSSSATVEEASK